jgi:hypothetical protein
MSSASLTFRATISRRFRSDAEVVTADTGPLIDLNETAATIVRRIIEALDQQRAEITAGHDFHAGVVAKSIQDGVSPLGKELSELKEVIGRSLQTE